MDGDGELVGLDVDRAQLALFIRANLITVIGAVIGLLVLSATIVRSAWFVLDAVAVAGVVVSLLVARRWLDGNRTGRALTLLAVAPSLLITMTSFTRIVVVLSIARNAVGLQSIPPNQVITGLMDLSSADESGMKEVAIESVIDRTLAALESEIKRSKVAILKDYAPSLPPCRVDIPKVEQVFSKERRQSGKSPRCFDSGRR